jgi:hypothetical protein
MLGHDINRLAAHLKLSQSFHRGRIDDCKRSTHAAAISHIDELRPHVIPHVIGIGIGTEIQGLKKVVGLRVVEAQLARLARYYDAVQIWVVNGSLRMFQASDTPHPLPRVHDLHCVVAKRRYDQDAALAVPPGVIDP